MKLALCLEYPIGDRGGVCVLVETLLRELVRHGHELVLVSPDTPESLRASEAGRLAREHIVWPAQPRLSVASAKNLARRLAESRPDLAHFHLGGNYGWGNRRPFHSPIYYLRNSGIPCVSTVHLAVSLTHGYSDPNWPLWYKWLRLPPAWWGKMQQLRHVRREIAVSQHDYRCVRRWYWPLRRRFVHIYHSRIADDSPPGTDDRRELVVLSAGHVARRKGQVVLAEAFARIAPRRPEWRLWLAGHTVEPDCQREIEQIAAGCPPDQIRLLGQRDDVAELMRRAAVFVQPSFHEGLPLALQEALYRGCACVATDIPGNSELIEHEVNGLLVPCGNPVALAGALDRLLGDAALRARLAANGPAGIRQRLMTAGHMLEKHLQLYDAILRTR